MNRVRALQRTGEIWLALLGVWAVLAFSQPDVYPGEIGVVGGILLIALVLLTHSQVAVRLPLEALALIVLALISPLWANSTYGLWEFGFKWPYGFLYATSYAVVTVAAGVFASLMTPQNALRIFDAAFKIVAAVTLVMIVAFPSAAFDTLWPNEGTLKGPFIHKNHLGTMLLLGVVTTLYANRGRRFSKIAWVALYLLLIVWCSSDTALVLAIATIVFAVLMRLWAGLSARRRAQTILPTAVFAIATTGVLIAYYDAILGVLGRDNTLSGRTVIWRGTIIAWQDKPFLGYGWHSAYEKGSPAATEIERTTGWNVPGSHDGYLSMLLQLGIVGFVLLLTLSLRTLWKTYRAVAVTAEPAARWAFLIAGIFVINNVIDTRLDSTLWFFLVAIAAWLSGGPKRPSLMRVGESPRAPRDEVCAH
nr:O-antigen ligase family protein [Mycobacterium sp.]